MFPCVFYIVGVPGFEPGVARTQNENVSRYTTLRCVIFQEQIYSIIISIIIKAMQKIPLSNSFLI
jgi:hypothetical protein